MMNLNPVERRPRCKRRKQTGHYEKTCAGGVVGSNPKVPKDITFVDGDTYTTYESGPSKRNEKDAKLVHGSFAGQSISVKGGKNTKSNSQRCVGESSEQGAARFAKKGAKGKAQANVESSQKSCFNQNFKQLCDLGSFI